MSFQISLNNNTSVFDFEYVDGIKLDRPYEVCLKSFVTYNNIPNVTPGNNEIIFIDQSIPEQFQVTIPTGTYEIDELSKLIESDSKIEGYATTVRLNKNTFRVEIKSNIHVDLQSPHTLGRTLGFSPVILKPHETHCSDLPVQLFTVNTIKIQCNLIKCNIHNLKLRDNTLYEFPLKCEGGEKIVERPITLCHYPVNTDNIYQLHLRVVDQDNELVDFRGEKITIVLGFQPVKV